MTNSAFLLPSPLPSVVMVILYLHCDLAGSGHRCHPGKLILGLQI